MVKIYTSPTCAYCPKTKKFLDKLGVKYEERNVEDREYAEEAYKLSGVTTVPIISYDNQVIIGPQFGLLAKLAQIV